MKKNHTVLVLLVVWTVLSISTLSSLACAGEIPDVQGPPQNEIIVPVNGADDDDSGGDPGDAGDGYGVDQPDSGGGLGGNDGVDDSVLDEIMLILTSLIRLAL